MYLYLFSLFSSVLSVYYHWFTLFLILQLGLVLSHFCCFSLFFLSPCLACNYWHCTQGVHLLIFGYMSHFPWYLMHDLTMALLQAETSNKTVRRPPFIHVCSFTSTSINCGVHYFHSKQLI